MKRVFTIALTVCFLCVCAATAWAAQPAIFVDGEELVSDTPVVIEEGRTLLPMRAVFEALDQKVEWDNEAKTVTAGDIVLQIDNPEAIVAGETYELDVPATLIEARTYVPVRFVAENLGCVVDFDEDTKRVDIFTEEEVVEEEATEDEAVEEDAAEDEAVEEEAVEDEAAADDADADDADAENDAEDDAGDAEEENGDADNTEDNGETEEE